MIEHPPRSDEPRPGRLDVVVDLAATMAMYSAERLEQIDELRRAHLADAAVAGRHFTDVVMRGLRLELAAAMRITEHAAGSLIALAEALVHRYPSAMRALERARITERHAEILVYGVDELEPELRAALFDRALALAEVHPVGEFRRQLGKLIESARVVTLAERHEAALVHRRVFVEPVGDGMAWTHHLGPEIEAHAAYGRATAIAKTILAQEGGTRTLDQIRADVVADLLIEGTTAAHPAEARGIRATVVVTVPALALLEQTDESVARAGADAATVEGIGPIPIARARELCGGDAMWMRVLTHPETGMVLSVGRTQYSPPASLRRLVKWRADRCMGPGCGMPASRCEVDHTIAWEQGGDTGLENLAPLCKGHHKVKHHGGWRLRQIADSGGAVEWISPAGRSYVVRPERRVPAFTVSSERTGVSVDDRAPF
ncbi:HNH endonuclease signature motif containing protein [Microbacterium sp. cf046]|uniref:HNH endonuclease signature motif containing protein n=1 Tax=Microbacterium sp. cf046 TaxID=1761803 RepID=UPI0020C85F5F|nr:HNH endonuclease signature motif containing protein [Microbacterium sp. cf046]